MRVLRFSIIVLLLAAPLALGTVYHLQHQVELRDQATRWQTRLNHCQANYQYLAKYLETVSPTGLLDEGAFGPKADETEEGAY